jgi:uncharacterized protein (DUF885 family)
MSFTTTTEAKESAYGRAQRVARRLRQVCGNHKAAMAAGTYNADLLVNLRDDLINADAEFSSAASVPGIVQYAKDVEDNQSYDVAANFTAMRAAVQATKTMIDALAPTSGGFLALWTFPAGSGLTPRAFSAGATADLRDSVQVIIDAID